MGVKATHSADCGSARSSNGIAIESYNSVGLLEHLRLVGMRLERMRAPSGLMRRRSLLFLVR
jgi:hypothetical protein